MLKILIFLTPRFRRYISYAGQRLWDKMCIYAKVNLYMDILQFCLRLQCKTSVFYNFTIDFTILSKDVKYLGGFLDNQLSWQPNIDQTIKKLSRACGMIFKLKYYDPLSTWKLIYYSMFHSVIQYSLLNLGSCKIEFYAQVYFMTLASQFMSCTMNF